MALVKSTNVPKDAVVVDEFEAASYAWDLISEWEPASDTWALRYSIGVLGGLSSVSGMIINNHFRKKLKLGTYGHMSSLIPVSLLPGIFTALFHRHSVSTHMLLMKAETCPLCYELRSGAIQLALGIAYPIVLAPTSALMYANRYNTYRLPNLTSKPLELLKFVYKLSKPLSATLVFCSTAHVVASAVLTHYEMKNHLTVRRKMLDIEAKFDAERNRK
ncbi:hypothetical protein JYU34_008912 [Plutella xylostella]|uniref:Uncharacterized protein n=1 Tax=Plutella xylostella TaxID=51655 RepID=A0ABQ7QM50_PLUXY|nr:hypothetical protein JYU34_008912 [Plutella xylostella]